MLISSADVNRAILQQFDMLDICHPYKIRVRTPGPGVGLSEGEQKETREHAEVP